MHTKFPFVQTGKIETCWRMLKSSFRTLKWNMHPKRLREILNTFCLRTMVKNYKVYHFAIKRLKDYSDYQLQKYFKRQPEGEFYIPNMQRID